MGFAIDRIEEYRRDEVSFGELVDRLATHRLGAFDAEEAGEDDGFAHHGTAGEINVAWARNLLSTEEWLAIMRAVRAHYVPGAAR